VTVADRNVLENTLKEALEKEIVSLLAETKHLQIREAMDRYYQSRLSVQIDKGEYGIQHLEARYLVEDLIENESELF
jgi:hypothetical protein